MNRGSRKVTDHNEELIVAQLNLKAGEKAMANSSFLQASIYLAQGTALIRDEDWTTHYNLCLRLFTICAESQLAHADYDGAIWAIKHVLSNGQSVEDKLRAYHACAIAFIAQAEMEKAQDLSLNVLNELGEIFLADPTETDARTAFNTTKTLIETINETTIGRMPTATDSSKVEAMRFLLLAATCSYFVSPYLYALLSFRMVQITLLVGITPESAYGFTSFSSFCAVFLENRSLGLERKCATISMELIKRFDKFAPVIVAMMNHSLFAYTQPIQACLEQIKHSYQLGMRGGDADWALSILPRVSKVGLFCGKPLDELESEMRVNLRELKTYKHYMLQVNMLVFQTVLNLRGHPAGPCPEPSSSEDTNDDPILLIGEAMDQSALLAEYSDRPMHNVIRLYYYFRMYLAYLFRRYDVAADLDETHRSLIKDHFFLSKMDTIYDTYETFYRGLIAYAILRHRCGAVDNDGSHDEQSNNNWRDIAKASMDQMKTGAEQGSEWNFRNKYELLSAEDAALRGDKENAVESYEAAIAKAEEHKFVNEQALACERYGLYLLETGGPDATAEGRKVLEKASDLYGSWGAARKAQDVLELLQEKEE
jgi:predicted ATPase